MHPRRKGSGFTLLELLVVVAIIAVLTAVVGPRLFGSVAKSEITAAKAQIDALDKAVDQFRLDVGRYPSNEEGLAALLVAPSNLSKWRGPYLKKAIPNDPWGNPYTYKTGGTAAEFEVLSFGKDGKPSGDGDAADLSNLR